MAGIRCFYEAGGIAEGAVVTLSKGESQHLVKVMRLREGSEVTLLDGRGTKAHCVLQVAEAKAAQVAVTAVEVAAEPRCSIHLAQVIPKGKSMDAIIRKATEIGVRSIYPLISEHSEVRLEGERGASKRVGWTATAIEACKQCGCPFLPEIYAPQPLGDFFAKLEAFGRESTWLFIASLEAGTRYLGDYRSDLPQNPRDALWMIGPEGDFSQREYAQARSSGCLPVRLAKNVLRSETAATYALSILDYELRPSDTNPLKS